MFNNNINTNNFIVDEELDEFLESLKVDYTQFYRGIVVVNKDPDKKGRVKVRIPQIYGATPDTQIYISNDGIPWANCAIQPAGNDCGTFLPPNIGDTVYVTFENGESIHPIYFGGVFTSRIDDDLAENEVKVTSSPEVFSGTGIKVTNDDIPLEVKEGTERVIYKSLKGAVIYIDDKDGSECIKIIDQSGQSIIMENLSEDAIKRRGDALGKNSTSQIVLTNNDGDSITLSHGKIHLKSANIILETDNLITKSSNNLNNEEEIADTILGE